MCCGRAREDVRIKRLLTSMMPSEVPVLPTQTEKPQHYTYLKEFRTQQCPLFLQHKCTQHRPYTCFHWHFLNQRRRRPVRRRDGYFSYSPDVYCTKYDETTGLCPEGDDCPLLHRTAGDTERRYHLRYYKTGTCVHETDVRGHCVKNGPHCAFAHGAPDLRPPVYDIRELQLMESGDQKGLVENSATAQLEKERMLSEDPRWNDTNYVLANYKTEPCKRPPRLCRQGYACPSYHNNRDRRRNPSKFKYRSTPCPNVKHGDDWGDPAQCDSGDACPYCHTRTEQQFHPEIYKSTKCNDMVQTGYCPRGPFCAFAHVEQEMTTQREVASACSGNSLAAFVTNALPQSKGNSYGNIQHTGMNGDKASGDFGFKEDHCNGSFNSNGDGFKSYGESKSFNDSVFKMNGEKKKHASGGSDTSQNTSNQLLMGLIEPLGPIGMGRSRSSSGGSMSDFAASPLYCRAPGSEREDFQSKLRTQLQAIEDDVTLDLTEKTKRKQNLLLLHSLNGGQMGGSRGDNNGVSGNHGNGNGNGMAAYGSSPNATAMSPHAPAFYPPLDTVESVIGNALDEDLNLAELSLSALAPDMPKDNDNDLDSVCSSLSTGFPASSSYFATSVPVTIPSSGAQRRSLGSLSQSSPLSSPIGSLPPPFVPQHIQQQQKQEQQLEQAAAAFLSQPNPGKFSAPGYSEFSMSPHNNSMSQSPLLTSSSYGNMNGLGEVQRLREELATNKAKLAQWEEGIAQARNACDAWKKETDETSRKAKNLEEDKHQIEKQRDDAMTQVNKLKAELEIARGQGPYVHCLQRVQRTSELEHLPLPALKQLQTQLRIDLENLEKIMYRQTSGKCLVCREKARTVVTQPCTHCVLCDTCAGKRGDCPYCHVQIQHRSNILMQM